MAIASLTLNTDYWSTFSIRESDLDYLYGLLLEIETPQTTLELARSLVLERIRLEKISLEKRPSSDGGVYLPKNQYQVNQTLSFPTFNWEKGRVVSVRPGNNPELGKFDVLEVVLETSGTRHFAARLEEHILNTPPKVNPNDPLFNVDQIMRTCGNLIMTQLVASLEANSDLVRIAGRWFPRALLVDVNIGHLNLVEAVLDMEGGGPLTARAILDQIDLPTDTNLKLTEFSLNLAIQEDGRFDEVGPAGEILWFLKRLEPEGVRQPPNFLQYTPIDYSKENIAEAMKQLETEVCDELEFTASCDDNPDKAVISLIYPHLRAGTLPLSGNLQRFFPTAYEAPRVRFNFVDVENNKTFSGWVVRPNHYVFGLREWYLSQGVIPGSLIHILPGKTPGEVIVKIEKRRQTREWIRTILIGADGGIVFAMLKQLVTATFDERMAIAIPDMNSLDQVWEKGNKSRGSLEQNVISMMRELAKLNPQGHIHVQELYAAINLIRRCPPGPLLSLLIEKPWSSHLGDLYFRLDESIQEAHA